LRVLINADQLAINRGANKGHKRPATPAQPARNRPPQTMAAGQLGQHAFRAKNAAPDAPQQHGAQHDERPPDTPKQKLREQPQIVQNMRILCRQGHEHRVNQEAEVKHHHRPLHAQDDALMAAHGLADACQHAYGRGGRRIVANQRYGNATHCVSRGAWRATWPTNMLHRR